MSVIHGTYRDGKIIPDNPPADWPEGKRVVIGEAPDELDVGMREEDWPTTPEGIAAWIARVDQLQPFLTPEEEAEWKKALNEQKAFELSKWEERSRKIEKLFE